MIEPAGSKQLTLAVFGSQLSKAFEERDEQYLKAVVGVLIGKPQTFMDSLGAGRESQLLQ